MASFKHCFHNYSSISAYFLFHLFFFLRSIATLSALGIIFALALLTWNLYYRKEPVIRASSPRINNAILVGSLFCYASAVLFGMDAGTLNVNSYTILCQARLWVFSLGFSLVFGGLFAKTLRVHRIFSSMTPIMVSDGEVFLQIVLMLVLDTVILLVWQIYDPLSSSFSFPESQTLTPDHILQPRIQHCTCLYFVEFMIALFMYKGVQVFIGAYLAYITRHVSLPAFNDSQYIGLCIYTISILGVIAVPVVHFVGDRPDLIFALTGSVIVLGTTTSLSILFIPKMMVVFSGEQAAFMRNANEVVQSPTPKPPTPKLRSFQAMVPDSPQSALRPSSIEIQTISLDGDRLDWTPSSAPDNTTATATATPTNSSSSSSAALPSESSNSPSQS
jgi:hypothetical protein